MVSLIAFRTAGSAERAPAGLRDAMDALARRVERGRCPADDFDERVAADGVERAVSALARDAS